MKSYYLLFVLATIPIATQSQDEQTNVPILIPV